MLISDRTKVINLRFYNVPCIYVGRPSKFGNPYKITKKASRGDVIRAFVKYLKSNKPLQKQAKKELSGRLLGCYCHPQPCHSDVLAKFCNNYTWREIESWANSIP